MRPSDEFPDPENLERLIHRALRSSPPRRAPASLEARVLAELGRRAALPWWRKSHTHWPRAVRGGFFFGAAAVAALAVIGLTDLGRTPEFARVAAAVAGRFAWLVELRGLAGSVGRSLAALFRAIPPAWLYGSATVVAVCYALLFAIGAVTYHTLAGGRSRS